MKSFKANVGLWLKYASVRALKTMAEAALATIGTGMLMSDVNWSRVVSTAALAGIISLGISVKGLPEVDLQSGVTRHE